MGISIMVTILMLILNVKQYLEKTLDSVLIQKMKQNSKRI